MGAVDCGLEEKGELRRVGCGERVVVEVVVGYVTVSELVKTRRLVGLEGMGYWRRAWKRKGVLTCHIRGSTLMLMGMKNIARRIMTNPT